MRPEAVAGNRPRADSPTTGAGLALSTAVKAGRLARTEVDEVLLHAAARVGLNSSKDVLPHITRGLREGGAA